MAVVLAVTMWCSTAADAGFIAETRDAARDSTSSAPARDLLAAGVGYDRRSGYMVAAVALRGAPSEESRAFISIYAGTRSPTGCDRLPAAGFGGFTDSFLGTWFRQDSPSMRRHGEADRSGYRSNVQTFEIRDRRMAGKKWECMGALLTHPTDTTIIYDQVPLKFFKGLPALALKMPKVKRALRPNRVRKLRVVIRNPGDGPLRNVKLRVEPTRGLRAAPRVKKIKLIRPRTRRVVWVNVKLSRRAGSKANFRVFVRSGKLKTRGRSVLRLKLPKKPPRSGGGNSGSGSRTCVQWIPDFTGESGGSLGLVPC